VQRFFTRSIYFDIVLDSLRFCQKEKGLIIYALVIMSNHIHLILRSETNNLSVSIRDFKNSHQVI
jgi:REP element-mobilizing transposase RayT